MHSDLTGLARCLYGDEYRRVPECAQEHREGDLIEAMTFARADALAAMVGELCSNVADGHLPVRVRNLAYRLALLQRPDDPELMRAAAGNLWMHGPDWDRIAQELGQRADALDGGASGSA